MTDMEETEREQENPRGFLYDEQGNKSSGRLLLFIWTAFATSFIVYAATSVLHFSDDVSSESLNMKTGFLSGIITTLSYIISLHVGWVAGGRVAKYLFPNIGNGLKAVASSFKRDSRLPSKNDDERKDY